MKEDVKEVVKLLSALEEDGTVPKNIKDSLNNVMKVLEEKGDISLKVNKALHILEEISNDMNMEPYTRTQLLNVVSYLERL